MAQLLLSEAPRGTRLEILRNDADEAAAVAARRPGHLVLSPGPGHPRDAGLSLTLPALLPETPILGVCLGHQALALAGGARVSRAPRPRHGMTSAVEHDGDGVFAGLPSPLDAARYHSLLVEREGLPAHWRVCAWTDRADIMALRHAERPHHGVQFHPESFMTAAGATLIRNFLELRPALAP